MKFWPIFVIACCIVSINGAALKHKREKRTVHLALGAFLKAIILKDAALNFIQSPGNYTATFTKQFAQARALPAVPSTTPAPPPTTPAIAPAPVVPIKSLQPFRVQLTKQFQPFGLPPASVGAPAPPVSPVSPNFLQPFGNYMPIFMKQFGQPQVLPAMAVPAAQPASQTDAPTPTEASTPAAETPAPAAETPAPAAETPAPPVELSTEGPSSADIPDAMQSTVDMPASTDSPIDNDSTDLPAPEMGMDAAMNPDPTEMSDTSDDQSANTDDAQLLMMAMAAQQQQLSSEMASGMQPTAPDGNSADVSLSMPQVVTQPTPINVAPQPNAATLPIPNTPGNFGGYNNFGPSASFGNFPGYPAAAQSFMKLPNGYQYTNFHNNQLLLPNTPSNYLNNNFQSPNQYLPQPYFY